MPSACGPVTWICVFILFVVAASLVIANEDDFAHERNYLHLARSVRSIGEVGPRRRGGGIAVDRDNRRQGDTQRGGSTENRGNSSGGRRGKVQGRGQSRTGPIFNKKETNLIRNLALANQNFSLAMYRLLEGNNPNLVFSPHSVHTALTMTYMGAKNNTATEMLRVLGLKKLKNGKAHLAYAALTQSLKRPSNVTLHLANAVFVKPNIPIEEAFRTGLSNMYKAGFDQFNFNAEGGPEAPINRWVSNMTAGKITSLLEENTITPLTAMVVLNAVYFKGEWLDKFNVADTREQDFYQTNTTRVPVFMMTRTGSYNYSRNTYLQADILELPYADTRYSMFIILPTVRNALDAVEQNLNAASFNRALESLTTIRMKVFLPKFKVESRFSLKEILSQMGMGIAFDQNQAKFGGICSVHDLFISDVIHQAVIEVAERGVEAAASTAVVINLRSYLRPGFEFRADHPFIYVIRDNVSKVVLFIGKYSAQQ